MATYTVIRRDPRFRTVGDGSFDVLDDSYVGDDLYEAGVDLDCRRLMDAQHASQWRVESDDPADEERDYPGDMRSLDKQLLDAGIQVSDVYERLVEMYGAAPYEAKNMVSL